MRFVSRAHPKIQMGRIGIMANQRNTTEKERLCFSSSFPPVGVRSTVRSENIIPIESMEYSI